MHNVKFEARSLVIKERDTENEAKMQNFLEGGGVLRLAANHARPSHDLSSISPITTVIEKFLVIQLLLQ